MDHAFWHSRWRENRIGFHEGAPNALLEAHFDGAIGRPGGRIFLPLCGKTRDIGWLLSTGRRVAGAELSETAVEQLFADLGTAATVTGLGPLKRFSAEGVEVFAGDIFDLTAETLGPVDAVYDRAALVALPADMRPRYAAHLAAVTRAAPQFLISFEYDQSRIDGPPFSVDAEEIRRCHGDAYEATRIARVDVPGGMKGQCPATESVWLLQPKR